MSGPAAFWSTVPPWDVLLCNHAATTTEAHNGKDPTMLKHTTASARHHFVEENEWTPLEFDAMINDIGDHDRTEEEWHEEAAAWAKDNIEAAMPTPTPTVKRVTYRKTLTITIDLEGAALSGDWGDHEAKEILQAAAERVHRLHAAAEWQTDEEPIPLRDSNGNRVGQITVGVVTA